MMLITPVTKSKQEKADSKNFDIFLLDSRGMQCSLNCKDTEIQSLRSRFNPLPTLYTVLAPTNREMITINRNAHTTPPRKRDVVAETVTLPFRRAYISQPDCVRYYYVL
jgi:hypothetical protein